MTDDKKSKMIHDLIFCCVLLPTEWLRIRVANWLLSKDPKLDHNFKITRFSIYNEKGKP